MGSRDMGSGATCSVGGRNTSLGVGTRTGANTLCSCGSAMNSAAASHSAIAGRRSHVQRASCSLLSGSERAHSQNASATSSSPSAAHATPGNISNRMPTVAQIAPA
jgi:hypothetical protein